MKYRLLYIVISILFFSSAQAQISDTSKFNLPLLRLKSYGDSLLRGSSDSVRISNNQKFAVLVDSILRNPVSYQLSFYQANTLSVINSDDGKFRIYNWMLPLENNNNYSYFGYIQTWDEKKQEVKLYHLNAANYPNNDEAETMRLDTSNWYGCIYYKVIHERKKKKDFYLLLGWSPHNAITTRKVIEPLILGVNKISFGSPVIKTGGKAKMRMIFEYNAQATMSLHYDEHQKLLRFDHLSSTDPRPESKGMYNLYGPDLSFDGLQFDHGLWYFKKDIDAKNDTNTDGKNPDMKKLRITK